MEKYIQDQGSVPLEDLVKHFDVSLNTIRRDIEELISRGNIKKVYGGVAALIGSESILINKREQINISSKKVIGSLAAQIVKDGSTLFLDSGTTIAQIIPYISNKENVTVVSNSLKAIVETSKYPNLKLYSLGGFYNYPTASFVGTRVIENISKLNFDHVFIGATGVSLQSGLTVNSFFEVDFKNWLIENNKGRLILLADSEKYDKSVLYSFSNFDDIDIFIAERPLPKQYTDRINKSKKKFICPEKKSV